DQLTVARLAPGESLARLRTILDQESERMRREFAATNSTARYRAVSEGVAAREELGEVAQRTYLISGLIGGLLLIACFNVGNMLLANVYRREREFAIRRAVGASSRRLVRQILGESLTIAGCGGLLGVLLSLLLIRLAG